MIDLNKSFEYFDPNRIPQPAVLVGCGALGSHMAEFLVRLGVSEFVLFDDDVVASHNIANQNFVFDDIGSNKVDVVADRIKKINPDANVVCNVTRLTVENIESYDLHGTIFMCVDSIEPRKMVASNFDLTYCDWYVDIRMALTSATAYVYKDFCKNEEALKNYIDAECNFTDDEADERTPVSACGFHLSVLYSVISACALAERMLINAIVNDASAYKGFISFDGHGFMDTDIYGI